VISTAFLPCKNDGCESHRNVMRPLEKLLRGIVDHSSHPDLVLVGVSIMIAALSILLRVSSGIVD
jgi:hypothetical protein